MSLFQKSVLNKYLNEQDETSVKEAFEKYCNYFLNPVIQQNIRESKEEQFQEGFLREMFVNIFGYTLNPNPDYNLTTEYKNQTGAKKADGAILKDGKAIGVIELKSTKTKDLETIRQQAFDYKANQSECVYVVTSNFQKIRFYINNAVEFEEFDLFALSEDRFKILYLCLNSENLLSDLPLKIKNASLLEEEQITKKFYSDYSLFKKELFEDIASRNESIDGVSKLGLYKKTQKLLDRFLFIFFAEDRGLLPPNSISRMTKRWNVLKDEDAYKPLYDIYKQYFGYLNKGRKGKVPADDIHEYNGGLFLTDDLLDKIEIDDDVLLKHTSVLTNYDFDSQVDVNILGHIFEHSLNEIESTTAELEGVDFDKQKSKRKKDGVFYTPKYITKYIVDNTVGKLCEEKRVELGIIDEEFALNRNKGTKKKLLAGLEAYRKWLLELTICDPACGSGAFLNQALEYLINEHHHIDGLNAQLFGSAMVFQDVENQILEKNIFGVDINEESVDIARLSLWLRTAQRGRKLTTLNKNIKCGNSLIDDPEVAGDKAFKWENEFPDVFAKGGFDVVLGNPPYVFARDKISQELKDYYTISYISAEYQVNTYLLFIEQSINIVRDSSNIGLIVPNAWLMLGSATRLRNFILQSCTINEIINLAGYSFEGVNVETIIILSTKTKQKDENNAVKVLLSEGKEFIYSHSRKQLDFENNEGFKFKVFSDETSVELTKKLKKGSKYLDDLVFIKAGLKAYEKDKGEPKQTTEDVKNRPFDYTYKFDKNTHKYLEGKDVG
ncbi:N-6 DNA methylase, partial [archaeon]|nr:N-6 DNA methylase [archaeon]